jgi:hypothetical protein
MKINGTTETEASKNDPRVTRIGKLMRKTSVDEMPQFFLRTPWRYVCGWTASSFVVAKSVLHGLKLKYQFAIV